MEHPTPQNLAEFQAFHRVSTEADELLEECIRDWLSLRRTLERFLPRLQGWIGAKGALLFTRDEHLVEQAFPWGDAERLIIEGKRMGEGTERLSTGDTLLWQKLDLAGTEVGRLSVLLEGDRTADGPLLRICLDAASEELDAVLATIHTASLKQQLILTVTEQLANPVFEQGVDTAVASLHKEICVPDFVLIYRDMVETARYHYRVYQHGALVFDSEKRPHPALEKAIRTEGLALLDPNQQLLRKTVGLTNAVESVLISGMTRTEWLGKVLCSAGVAGFSTFGLDVVQVMCEAMSERLVDFNRERRHLAQFFAPRVITELLHDPHYRESFLTAREEVIAVLYADINSFTRISEQVLESPAQIAEFVDRWSAGAVQLLWDHNGVFDKMVGDCVIGLFGPPFFKEPPAQRALSALKAAKAISEFTISLEKTPPYDRIPASGAVPGLGVAVALNLCPMSVGMLGPNQDYTGFSSGMNCTARLQSLAHFRETLAMESFCEALGSADDPLLKTLQMGELTESPVKNVRLPLRFKRIAFG